MIDNDNIVTLSQNAIELEICYHCGESVPSDISFTAVIDAVARSMCCPGCQAVAEMICGAGMTDFYKRRTHYAQTPDPHWLDSEFGTYDDPSIRRSFAKDQGGNSEQVQLLVIGMTCAACSWLIERRVLQQSGVTAARIKLSDASLSIDITSDAVLSKIMRKVADLGYKVQPFKTSEQNRALAQENTRLLKRLAVAGLGMMQVGMFAIALHAGDIQGIEPHYQQLMRWVSLPIAVFVAVYSGGGFFKSAWHHLRHGALIMDLPITIAITLALGASVYATVTASGNVYFDSVVMFTFFLLVARYFEQRGRFRNSLLLQRIQDRLPLVATRITGNQSATIPVQEIQRNDRLRIFVGEVIPVDGVLVSGQAEVEESAFTGESLPRLVAEGESLCAGTCNLRQSIDMIVTNPAGSTRLDALEDTIHQAETTKPRLVRVVDTTASYFIALVLAASLMTGLAWWWIDPANSFWIALSVLVVSCPCALGLATPAALTSAVQRLRKSGIVIRGDNAIEELSRIDYAVFDKTGTLTDGQFECVETQPQSSFSAQDCYLLASTLQAHSKHPTATAFTLKDNTPVEPSSTELKSIVSAAQNSTGENAPQNVAGMGLCFLYNNIEYRLGQPKFAESLTGPIDLPETPLHWLALSRGKKVLCLFGIRDNVRPSVPDLLAYFRQKHIKILMLTGDHSPQARSIAESLNIDDAQFGLSPEEKLSAVTLLQRKGHRVLMVGDGVNDAPVLAHSIVGIAVAEATDLARARADMAVTEDDLGCIELAHRLAKKTRATILQNIAWALTYNAAAIPLACMGYVLPWAAALGMSASSLVVVMNSLRLHRTSLS